MASIPESWSAHWPQALAAWSPYTQLRPPVFYASDAEAKAEGMAGQIAAIRLDNQTVMVNAETVARLGLEGFALPVLAHEIGHHVYVPANLLDNGRMLAAMKAMLAGLSSDAPALVANLYGDLLINDRLQRRGGLDMAGVYRKLYASAAGTKPSRVWQVYMRSYEHLWRLPAGTLIPAGVPSGMNADAALIARLVRHFSDRWLSGARRFAAILYPYLAEDEKERTPQTFVLLGLSDCKGCCAGALPDGLAVIDASEVGDDDDFDRALEGPGEGDDDTKDRKGRVGKESAHKPENTEPTLLTKKKAGQHREPFEYGELLRALGLKLSDHEVTTRYYRERALPYLLPFPARKAAQKTEPLAEGYEGWDAGEDLDKLDLFGTILRSPELVPGVTTVQRVYGESPGSDPAKVPLDLDIYVDCSGSMPNPAVNVSYLALAGTILALSALRVGARVQATLWSGPRQFDTTGGFIRDEKRILGVVTGYISGSTAFPLHVLRDTYEERSETESPVHIVVISDEGVDTILHKDEKRNDGTALCRTALRKARGGGTLVLNLPNPDRWPPREKLEAVGFKVHGVTDWEELIAFARMFVRETYEERT